MALFRQIQQTATRLTEHWPRQPQFVLHVERDLLAASAADDVVDGGQSVGPFAANDAMVVDLNVGGQGCFRLHDAGFEPLDVGAERSGG